MTRVSKYMSACHIGNYVKKLKEKRKKKMGRDPIPISTLFFFFFLNVFGVIASLTSTIIDGCSILFMEGDSLTTIPAINQAPLYTD